MLLYLRYESRARFPVACLSLVASAAALTGCANAIDGNCGGGGSRSGLVPERSPGPAPVGGHAFNVTNLDPSYAPPGYDSAAQFATGFVTFSIGKDPYAFSKPANAALKDRDKATCNAAFRFKREGGLRAAEVTTAAHCFRGMMALVTEIKVDVFDPTAKAYFATTPAWSPFVERRAAMLASLAAKGFPAPVKELVAWDFLPGMVGLARDGEFDIRAACSVEEEDADPLADKPLHKDPYSQLFCFSGSDLVHFDVVFEKPDGKAKAPPDFLRFVDDAIGRASDSPPADVTRSQYDKAKAIYERKVLAARGAMESGVGDLLDALSVGCSKATFETLGGKDVSSLDPSVPVLDAAASMFRLGRGTFDEYRSKMAAACAKRAEFEAVAEAHVRFMGLTPSQVRESVTLKDPIKEVRNAFVLEGYATGDGGRSLSGDWDAVVPELKSRETLLKAHFNLSDDKGNPIGPASVPLPQMGRSPALVKFRWPRVFPGSDAGDRGQAFDTLFVSVPKNQVRFGVREGDSGTVLALGGVWPLMVLSSVDGNPTSGGASVTALPRRSGGSAGKPGAKREEAKNGKENGRQTTQGNCDG